VDVRELFACSVGLLLRRARWLASIYLQWLNRTYLVTNPG